MQETGVITAAQVDEAKAEAAAAARSRPTRRGCMRSTWPRRCARLMVRAVRRQHLHARPEGLHLAGREPTRRRPTGRCARHHGLRTAPALSRARSASSTCPTDAGGARRRRRRCAGRSSRQRRRDGRRGAAGRRRSEVVAVRANGDPLADHRRGPAARAVGRCRTRRRRTCSMRRGAVIRVAKTAHAAAGTITQLPEVEGAFVALDPRDGAVACAGRRLRFRQEQVQPCDAGLAPAGLELQALHLFGRAREGLHARHRGQRRAAVLRRRRHRRPAVGAEELRRHLRRPDDACAAR